MSETTRLSAYRALALQLTCHTVNSATHRAEAEAIVQSSIARIGRQLAASIAFIGADCKLVVLPEYALTGFPMGESIEAWRTKACFAVDGAEYEALAALAQRHAIHLCLNTYEVDPHFPSLYFQASVILGPTGNVVLRYRRLISMFAPTPHDVWDGYLDRYGLDGVFPVARTELGNLACIASEEILYPEVARCLAVRGAEVFLHCTSEVYGPGQSPKEVCKRARAIENLAYVVSANSAGMLGTAIPAQSVDGGSKVVDYRGLVLVDAGPGETMSAFAAIDIEALRAERRRPGMSNLLARQRFELYADTYAHHSLYPPNTIAAIGDAPLERRHFLDTQRRTIDALVTRGVIT